MPWTVTCAFHYTVTYTDTVIVHWTILWLVPFDDGMTYTVTGAFDYTVICTLDDSMTDLYLTLLLVPQTTL